MYEPTSSTPITSAVSILHDFALGGVPKDKLETAYESFAQSMSQWAMNQLREDGWEERLRKEYNNPEFLLSVEFVTDEAMENTAVYDAYYANTSKFIRKAFQTAASSY